MRGTALHDRLVLAGAALFTCAHLLWLSGQLEDIDSINFALGVLDYDVGAHQPHPPGYPLLMLLARGVALLLTPLVGEPLARATLALTVLAAISGGLAIVALYHLLAAVNLPAAADSASRERDAYTNRDACTDADLASRESAYTPLAATALTAASPLFWITAARPLSDMPGLAGAIVCQWLLLRAAQPAAAIGAAYVAAVACGVAVGLRSQVTWLVVPLLAWMWWRVGGRAGSAHRLGIAAAALAGVLTWALPMVALSGGLAGYRAALSSQAGEDFEGVPMLFLQPGVRRLLTTLLDSFVTPWAWLPLAVAVLVAALLGVGVVLVRRQSLRLIWLVLGFGPYLVFHLLFQETETTRYALPLVVPTAVLAVAAWSVLPRAIAGVLAAVAIAVALGVSAQAHRQYVSAGMTVGEVLAEMQRVARQTGSRPQVLMHRRVWAETRRARGLEPSPAYDALAAPQSLEWQQGLPAWSAGQAPVWWLVDPRRGDRVAVDPRAMTLRRRVAWPEPVGAVLGGMRPHAFDWYDVQRPQWVLQRGWSLTPELAGLAAAAREGPATTGATAAVQSWSEGGVLVLGGRRVSAADATPVALDVSLGQAWTRRVAVPPGDFVAVLEVPATTGREYLSLQVRQSGPGDAGILLEQFDAQPRGVPVLALESGWYEPERDVTTGRMWRWVGDRSTLRIANAAGDVRLVVEGTWPRHYDRAPVLELYVGERRIASHELARPFRIEQSITAELMGTSGGRVEWRVAPSFVAGERTGTQDARRLALEIASLRVDAIR